MDRFLSTKPLHIFEHEFTNFGPAVCVLGKAGIGKTWTVHRALDPCIEIGPDILRSKQDTIDFLDKIRGRRTAVIIDEYEAIHDLVGLREIREPPTAGLFVVVSQIPVKFDFKLNVYDFPAPSPERIREIVPDASDDVIRAAKGDLRWVIQATNFNSDLMDDFRGPKDLINMMVMTRSDFDPARLLNEPVPEPGHMSSILHENHTEGRGRPEEVMELLSQSAILEDKIYDGNWDLLPYFNILGIVMPAIEIGHTISKPLRPGSSWTKFQNGCMRAKRIQAMMNRIPGRPLTMYSLLMLRSYAETGSPEAVGLLREYAIGPADLDVMNHLSPFRKIKPKTLTFLKKCLATSAD
jgi:hypothetical protein